MRLHEHETKWWRERFFAVWDRTGGPGRFGTWAYEHPKLGYIALLVLAVGFVGFWWVLGREPVWASWGAAVLLVVPAYFWRLQVKVFGQWLEQRDPAAGPREPVEGGWWERTVADQQARAEVENQQPDGALLSPVLNRLFGLSFLMVGVGLVALIALGFLGLLI